MDITQRIVVIPYRRFRTTYRPHLQRSSNPELSSFLLGFLGPWKMGPKVCPETSVRNNRCTLRNNPEERRSHLLRGGSLQSCIKVVSSEKGVLLPLVVLARIWDCLIVA